MKPSNILTALFVAASTLAPSAFAQPAGVPFGTVARNAEVRHELRDDRRDVRSLERIQSRYAAAARPKNRAMLRMVEADLSQHLRSALREQRDELAARQGDRHFATPVGTRGGFRQASRELIRTEAIDRELSSLYGRFDRYSLSRKEQLIAELLQLERMELRNGAYAIR